MTATKPLIKFDHHQPVNFGGVDDGSDPQVRPPMVRYMREVGAGCPMGYSQSHGGYWVVFSHELISQIQADPETFTNERTPIASDGVGGMFVPPTPETAPGLGMMPGEPPLERNFQIRRAMVKKFSQKAVSDIAPQIRAYTEAQTAKLAGREEFDLIHDVGFAITPKFIAKLIGFADEHHDLCLQASHMSLMVELDEHAEQVREQVNQLTSDLIADRRKNPTDDLTSLLVQYQNGTFTDIEVGATLWTLLLANIETTTASLASTLLYLQYHPELRAQMIADPQPFKDNPREFLRYFTPTMYAGRTVTRDVEIAGHLLTTGDRMLLAYAAANHDPTLFDNPDTIDFSRKQDIDQTFGKGVHRCVGQYLAPVAFEIVTSSFLEHFPDYLIDADRARRSPHIGTVNAWKSMPIHPTGFADMIATRKATQP